MNAQSIRNDASALFQEIQQFHQKWMLAVMIIPISIPLGILIYQLITGELVGSQPAPNWVLVLFTLVLGLPALGFFYIVKLKTRLDQEGLHFGWQPFNPNLKTYRWDEIATLSLVRYGFVGYGLRLTRKYGIVHNVSGNKGLLVETKKGKKFMIGTNKPDELDSALRKFVGEQAHLSYVNTLDSGVSSPRLSGLSSAEFQPYT